MIVQFFLPLPVSLNRLYRSARKQKGVYMSATAKAWHDEAAAEINLQRVPHMEPPYRVEYAAGRPDKRRRDIGNIEKILSDRLQKSDVIGDDKDIHDMRLLWADDVHAGWVRVTIETLGDDGIQVKEA